MKKSLFASGEKKKKKNALSVFNVESKNSNNSERMGYCARLWAEFKHPWFVVQEVFDNKVIDLQRSFAPEPKRWVASFKLILCVWVYQVLFMDLMNESYDGGNIKYYLIYLTHWAFLASLIYFPCSLILSLCGNVKQPNEVSSNDARALGASNLEVLQQPSFMVRLTWGLFSTTATLQVVVTLLFWLLEYSFDDGESPTYTSMMKHGGIMVLVFIEGLVVNKIPVRAKHLFIAQAVSVAYSVWTILHSKLGIGNVFSNGGDEDEENDDVIYGVVNWRDYPKETSILMTMVVLVVVPVLFLMLWAVSQFRRRHVIIPGDGSDVESGSAGSSYFRMRGAF